MNKSLSKGKNHSGTSKILKQDLSNLSIENRSSDYLDLEKNSNKENKKDGSYDS